MTLVLADGIVLRPWTVSDRDGLVLQANDLRVARNMRDRFPHPYSLADADRFISLAFGMDPQTFFAIEVSGAIAGGIGYTLHDDVERVSAEVGYWLGVSYWGRGIATTAVRGLTDHAFSAHGHLRRLYALPFSTNLASARVLEKAGYEREATLRQAVIKEGVVLDQWVYARLRKAL